MSDSSDAPSGIERRSFLKMGVAGLAGLSTLGAGSSPARPRAQPVEITYAFGPDDSGTLQPIIDDFNRDHSGEIRVRWQEMDRASDAYYRQLVSDFEAEAADMDVFGSDVVWTAPLVRRGWIKDLTRRFHRRYDPDQFVQPALQSAAYRFRIWGVPWYTDAGVLFYRRDLLEESGFSDPPSTWDALISMAQQVQSAAGIEHGFVFQGDAYEGGVANALEFIWNAGGRVMTLTSNVAPVLGQSMMDPNVITVDSEEAAAGLDAARRLITDGVTPEAVADFREEEAWDAFLGGRAVFMRNWPYVYGLLDSDISTLSADQIGIAPLPAAPDHTSYSCLGGWNLMINAQSPPEKQEAAWTFIQYLTAPSRQMRRAVDGGFLPTRAIVYEEPSVKEQAPGVVLSRDAVQNARVRPVSPYYMNLAPRISRAFSRTLRGELTGAEAVRRLAGELRTILRRVR